MAAVLIFNSGSSIHPGVIPRALRRQAGQGVRISGMRQDQADRARASRDEPAVDDPAAQLLSRKPDHRRRHTAARQPCSRAPLSWPSMCSSRIEALGHMVSKSPRSAVRCGFAASRWPRSAVKVSMKASRGRPHRHGGPARGLARAGVIRGGIAAGAERVFAGKRRKEPSQP
jgi:hypothetical protein